jgi:nitrogen fixation NifU-like protein
MLELSEKIKEHFRNPQNVGEIENPEGTGTILNPVCGDKTVLYLRIKEGIVEDAKFLSFGCAVTIASASVLTEKIKGKEISKLFSGTNEEVIQRLMSLIESELGEIPPCHRSGFPRSHYRILGKGGKDRIKLKSPKFDPPNIRVLQKGRREGIGGSE